MSEASSNDREVIRTSTHGLLELVESSPLWREFNFDETEHLLLWKALFSVRSGSGSWGQFCRKVATLAEFLIIVRCVTPMVVEHVQDVRQDLARLERETPS